METDVVPSDLAVALVRAGYRVAGPVGIGSHGPAWAATGREGGPAPGSRVVVTMLAVPAGGKGAEIWARLDALRAVRHDHLAPIVGVVPIDEPVRPDGAAPPTSRGAGRWAVLLAEVPGTNLSALLAARPPLTDGETVTLTIPLAEALAALHDAGLAHGDVSPANVVIRPEGRPVLVDLLGALMTGPGVRAARGTPGFAAPELDRGAGPGPAADVHALARVSLAALGGAGGPQLRAALEQACAAAPSERPSAGALAAQCYAAADPEPLAVPDAAVLARTTLARLAVGPKARSVLTVRPSSSRHRATRGRLGAAGPPVLAVVAFATCGAVAAGVIGWGPFEVAGPVRAGGAAASSSPTPAPAAGDRRPGSAPSDPLAAAVALTERRVEVLVAGDSTRFDDVDLVGAGAHDADVELLRRLATTGERIQGLTVSVGAVRLVDDGAGAAASPAQPGAEPVRPRAQVEVTSALTAYRRVSGSGSAGAKIPAQPPRTVVLSLVWTPGGWRVAEVTAPVSQPGG